MKYFISHIVLLIYLVGLFGWQVNKHYSGGELFDVSLFTQAEKCCEPGCDCCTDTSDTYQLKVDQDIAQQPDVKIVTIELFIQSSFIELPKVETDFVEPKPCDTPPLIPYKHSISNLQAFLC